MNNDIIQHIDDLLNISCHKLESVEACQYIIDSKFNIKILTFNIRSITKNFDAFLVALNRLNIEFDAIILTECWLESCSLIKGLDGYTTFHTEKITNQNGGVVVYVKELWSASAYEPEFNDANCLVVDIPQGPTILGIYRSPSESCTDAFGSSLETLVTKLKHKTSLVVCGDANIDILPANSDSSRDDYLCLLAESDLIPAITKPTRLKTCLDHIFVRKAFCDMVESIICTTAVTDHDLVMIGIQQEIREKRKHDRYITKIDYEALSDHLRNVDWAVITDYTNTSEAATEFTSILNAGVAQHSSQIRLSRTRYNLKPWITPGLIRCMKHKDQLHLKYRKKPNDPIVKVTFLRYRNFCNDLLHRLKSAHERKMLEESKSEPKKLWKVIKNICHKNRSATNAASLIDPSGTVVESLNKANEYFATVGEKLANEILNKLGTQEDHLAAAVKVNASAPLDSFFFHPTDSSEISKIIKQLKEESAPGNENIKATLLKRCLDSVVDPLAHIVNLSFSSGVFPDHWKIASVAPIHKSGPRDAPSNYRPISLLSIVSKVLEKVANNRLVCFLENTGAINSRQFGFRRGKSTEDAVSLLVDMVAKHLDSGVRCLGVFLDLAKAFDTVSVPILIWKLEALGIRGLALDWFNNYLTGRRQCVKIGPHISDQI